jgi:6-phosphogluconolactonase
MSVNRLFFVAQLRGKRFCMFFGHRTYRVACSSLILAVGLAACGGGGGGGGAIPHTTTPTGPSTYAAKSNVSFRITVPKASTSTAVRPAYVSPATQSMTIAIMQGGTSVLSQTAGLTASSTGCTSSLASVTCTLSVNLNPGSYTASVSTYDGPNGTGNVLSTAQGVAFTVTAGASNLVPLSLSGVPTKILVVPASATSVYAEAQDADGNFIVGSGAPTYTAAKTAGASVASITQPTASAPNTIAFAVPSPAPSPGTETIAITASFPAGQTNGCAQTGASCTASTSVTASYGSTAFVTNDSDNNVLGFLLPLASASQQPTYTISTSQTPYVIASDALGNLFVPGYGSTSIFQEFSPPYSGAAVTNSTGGGNDPYGVAVAPNGDVAVANHFSGINANSVTLYVPPYTASPTKIGTLAASAVAFDSSNNLYVANSNSTLSEYAPPYTGTPLTVNTSSTGYDAIVSGNKLFIAEGRDIDVFSLPITSTSTPSATLTTSGLATEGIAIDPSGNLWAASYNGGANSDGFVAEFPTPFSTGESASVTLSAPFGSGTSYYTYDLAFDPAGNLYILNGEGGSNEGGLIEFTPPITSSSTPSVVNEGGEFYYLSYLTITPPVLSVTP